MSLLLENIRKSYREPDGGSLPVLEIERFELGTGEQVALVGASGGGKTTLLNVISGITAPDAGRVVIDDTEVTGMPEQIRDRFRAERIGFVYQTFNLLPAFTALENVLLGMSFSRGRADRDRALQLLESVGLSHRLDHRPGQLSVGEQQRVAVARALANQPSLLLADEPTGNLDSDTGTKVIELMFALSAELGTTLLLITHASAIAEQCDRTIRIDDGLIVNGATC